MFFGVLRLTYHSPITIESLTYPRVPLDASVLVQTCPVCRRNPSRQLPRQDALETPSVDAPRGSWRHSDTQYGANGESDMRNAAACRVKDS